MAQFLAIRFPLRFYASTMNWSDSHAERSFPRTALPHESDIMAPGSGIEVIGIWIDQRGSTNTSDRVISHLQVPKASTDAIIGLMADLVARCKPEEKVELEDGRPYYECNKANA
ncbi:hypothetical protein [Pseudomonas sp. C9]|uniref:hypothetical protein n=1 Tax=Pseudomonas sp. C9 TaxID=1311337 RepID=UPI002114DC27|nr:hypothetical protein [Pseudomonas sp. C9]